MKNRGFTLIELMLVVAIACCITAVLVDVIRSPMPGNPAPMDFSVPRTDGSFTSETVPPCGHNRRL